MAGVANGCARAAKRSGPAPGRPGNTGSGAVFRTFARELSFLGYFGHNWDALVDCLHDWHGPGHGTRTSRS
ncbi:barstar family protein [Streptomyces sp. NPDC059499]|uniref:barstar family protein n=1 Tax=Streptomyces sp. NPDC059499 TaxID=3346852 RepID=UPI0036A24332